LKSNRGRRYPVLVSLAGALRIEQGHADFVGDLVEFFVVNGVEGFAATFEMLVYLDRLLLHRAVGFLAAADELEILAGGDASMAVLAVEAEAQQAGVLLRLWRFALLAHGAAK
jgi:hypothetical protein